MEPEEMYVKSKELEVYLNKIHQVAIHRFEMIQSYPGLLGWSHIEESEWIVETMAKLREPGSVDERLVVAKEVLRALEEDRLRKKDVGLAERTRMAWNAIKGLWYK